MHDKAFDIDNNSKYDGYQHGLTSISYKFFDKKTSGSGIKNEKKKCVIDIFSKYTWVVSSKDKKGNTEVVTKYKSITNVFQNILNESNRKPKKYG